MQPPLKWHKICEKEFRGSYIWFYETILFKVDVVEECPPQNLNPPLTEPDAPLLVQVREYFSDPFSLFCHPPTMSRTSVAFSVVEPSSPYLSGTMGIHVISTLTSLSSIRPTSSMPFYIGPSI